MTTTSRIDTAASGIFRHGSIAACLALVRAGASAVAAAPAVLIGRMGFYPLAVWVLTLLWQKVRQENIAADAVATLPANGMLFYVGVTEWILLSVPAIHLQLEDDIRRGAIEGQLLRPQSPLLLKLAETTGAMLMRMLALGASGVVLLLFATDVRLPLSLWAALLFSGLLGAIIGLLIFAMVGLTACWLRKVLPVYLGVQKMCFLLGGLFAPVTLYPEWLAHIAQASPFAAQLYWPAIIASNPSDGTITRALTMQLLWIAILIPLLMLLWRRARAHLLREGI